MQNFGYLISNHESNILDEMYEIKPTFDRSSIQVDLPTCMYKMKTINEFGNIETQSSGAQLTNGLNGAVSQLSSKSLPDVSLQIEKLLKVFLLLLRVFLSSIIITPEYGRIHCQFIFHSFIISKLIRLNDVTVLLDAFWCIQNSH